jgi:thioredoxin 1
MLRSLLLVAPIAAQMILVAPALAHPPVFSDVSYADAKQANASDGKYLIIKATAVWCGPCKKMDKTTWIDEQVVAWVKEKGVAIALDVDEKPDDAKALRIEAMPTMMIFKEGKELDRVVGYRSAEQMLAWFADVQAGKTTAKRLEEKAGKRAKPDGSVDVYERMQLAKEAVQARKFDMATEEYLWLWDNMLEFNPNMYGVRLSFMVGDMQELSRQHAPAKDAFTKKRDDLEAKLRARTSTIDTLVDWGALNQVLDDEERTLAWYDRVKDDPEAKSEVLRMGVGLDEILKRKQRWADVGRFVDLRQLSWMLDDRITNTPKPEQMSDESYREFQSMQTQRQHEQLADMHAHLLAAKRDADAATLAKTVLSKRDTPAMRRSLVTQAVAINVATKSMADWLDEADKADPEGKAQSDALRAKLPKE